MQKYLVLSFDDGTIYDERFVELLNRYRLPATFNLNSGLDDFVWHCEGQPIRRLVLSENPGLYRKHEVASHTLTHPCLTDLSDRELTCQVRVDVDNLRRIYGREITSFAVPFDQCTDREIGLIKEVKGLKCMRLSVLKEKYDFRLPEDPWQFEVNALYQDEDIFEQIKAFAENPLEKSVFIIAGHSYEFEMNNHWEYVEKLLQYIASFEEFETVTFSEAAKNLFNLG